MTDSIKQSVTGFKIVSFQVKKGKESETVKLLLEADVDAIGCGSYNMGDVLKSFLTSQTGDSDVGLNIFVDKQ